MTSARTSRMRSHFLTTSKSKRRRLVLRLLRAVPRAEVELVWLHRDAAGADLSDLLAGALRRLDFPRGKVFAWAAGEASSMRQVRRHLLDERGLPPEQARVTGYWKRAIANYDHHQPLES